MFKKLGVFLIFIMTALFLVACGNTDKITISDLPSNLVFEVGEELELEGLKISVTISGETIEVTYPNDLIKVSGYDKTKVGQQTITISYLTLEVTFQIEVKNKTEEEKPVVDIPDDATSLTLIEGLTAFNLVKLDNLTKLGLHVQTDTEMSINGQYIKIKGELKAQNPKSDFFDLYTNVDLDIQGQKIKAEIGRQNGLLYVDGVAQTQGEKTTLKQIEKLKRTNSFINPFFGGDIDLDQIAEFNLETLGVDITDLENLQHVTFYKKDQFTYGEIKLNQDQVKSFIKPIYEKYYEGDYEDDYEDDLDEALSQLYTELDLKLVVTLQDESLYAIDLKLDFKNKNITNHLYFSLVFTNPQITHPNTSDFESVYSIGQSKSDIFFVIPMENGQNHIVNYGYYDNNQEKVYIDYQDVQETLRYQQIKPGYYISKLYLDKEKTKPFIHTSDAIEVAYQEAIYFYVDFEENKNYIDLNIVKNPDKQRFEKDEAIDLTGLEVELTLENGQKELLTYEQIMEDVRFEIIMSYNNVRIIFNDGYDYFEKHIEGIEIVSIYYVELISHPSKNIYKQGEILDLTGGQIMVNYSDGSYEILNIEEHVNDFQIISFDANQLGQQEVFIRYKDADGFWFNIVVVNETEYQDVVSEIIVTKYPDITVTSDIYQSQFIGLEIELLYTTGHKMTFTYEQILNHSGEFDFNIYQDRVHIVYTGEIQGYGYSVSADIGVDYYDIGFNSSPNKLYYALGEALDLTGLSFYIYRQNSEAIFIEYQTDNQDITYLGFDKNQSGYQYIDIYYKGIYIFNIDVYVEENVETTISHFEVVQYPYKTVYYEDEPLDFEGAVVIVYYQGSDHIYSVEMTFEQLLNEVSEITYEIIKSVNESAIVQVYYRMSVPILDYEIIYKTMIIE